MVTAIVKKMIISVITSYSIHYTKLYEISTGDILRGAVQAQSELGTFRRIHNRIFHAVRCHFKYRRVRAQTYQLVKYSAGAFGGYLYVQFPGTGPVRMAHNTHIRGSGFDNLRHDFR